MGNREFEKATEPWEMVRRRRLRNARVNKIEAGKDLAYKHITGKERPHPTPEGEVVIVNFQTKQIIRRGL